MRCCLSKTQTIRFFTGSSKQHGCAIGERARTVAAYRKAVCGRRREAPPPIVHLRQRRCTRARGAVGRRQRKWGGVTAWRKPQIACNRCHTPRLSIPSTYPAHRKTPRLCGCAIGERARTVAAYRKAVCGRRREAPPPIVHLRQRRCTRARGAVGRRQRKWGGVTAWRKPPLLQCFQNVTIICMSGCKISKQKE